MWSSKGPGHHVGIQALIVDGIARWPGMPPLAGYTAVLRAALDRLYATDPRVYERYPPAGERPEEWVVRVRRRRALESAAR